MLRFYAPHWFALGDTIVTMYVLENLGRQKKESVVLSAHPYSKWKEIGAVFNFRYLRVSPGKAGIILDNRPPSPVYHTPIQCGYDHLHDNRYGDCAHQHYCVALSNFARNKFGYDPRKAKSLLHSLKAVADGQILVQFDGRTARRLGCNLPREMKLRLISALSGGQDYSVIGGPDTQRYLGEGRRYLTGNIKFIGQRLLGCCLFIGADSGLSHYAGALGVQSKILIANRCFPCLHEFYKNYSRTKTYSRQLVTVL